MFQCVGVHQGLSLSKLTSRLSRGGNALRFHKNSHPYFQDKPEPAFRACEILQFFQVLVSRTETRAATTRWISTRISFESWFRYTKLFDLANIHCNCDLIELAICWSIHVTSLKSKIRRNYHCVSSQVLRFVPPRSTVSEASRYLSRKRGVTSRKRDEWWRVSQPWQHEQTPS